MPRFSIAKCWAAALLAVSVWPADLERALALYRSQDFRGAEAELRNILRRDKTDSSARIYLVRALIEQNRVTEALQELDAVIAQDKSPSVRFQAGDISRQLAERRLASLRAIAPKSAALHELSGRQRAMKGQFDEALKEYEAAANLEPQRPGIHYWLGSTLWRLRRLEDAKRELQAELSASPHHAMANLRLGQTLIAMNDESAAIGPLELAVQAMPNSMEGHKALGSAYFKVEQIAAARREWELVARQMPTDDQIHYLLGGLYRKTGETAKAQAEFAKHKAILDNRRKLAGDK